MHARLKNRVQMTLRKSILYVIDQQNLVHVVACKAANYWETACMNYKGTVKRNRTFTRRNVLLFVCSQEQYIRCGTHLHLQRSQVGL